MKYILYKIAAECYSYHKLYQFLYGRRNTLLKSNKYMFILSQRTIPYRALQKSLFIIIWCCMTNIAANTIQLGGNFDHIRFENIPIEKNFYVSLQASRLLTELERAKHLGDARDISHIYLQLAEFFYKLNQPKQAIIYLDNALNYNAKNAYILYLKGLNYLALKEYALASSNLLMALQIDDSLYEAHYANGVAKFLLDDFSGAIKELTTYLEFNQNDDSYFYRALAYLGLKEYDSAMDDLYLTIQLNPQHTNAYFYLATTSSEVREFAKAKQYYKKVMQLSPEHEFSYINFLELNLILDEPFNTDIQSIYQEKFPQKTSQIFFDMLKIFADINNTDTVALSIWQQKYRTISLSGWQFDLLEKWIATKPATKRQRLEEVLKFFKNHTTVTNE